MVTGVLLLSLALSASPAEPGAALAAPQLEGGSKVTIGPRGRIEVRDARSGRLRWEVGLGAPARHIAVDDRALYVTSGQSLRAFGGGVARWSLNLGAPSQSLKWAAPGQLQLTLPSGTAYVNARRGHFCTPRTPCPGLPTWQPLGAAFGVPYLDLPGLGVPGLGLVLNPGLLNSGDTLLSLVPPGPVPGLQPYKVQPPQTRSRSIEVGGGVTLKKGRSGKMRGLVVGPAAAPSVE